MGGASRARRRRGARLKGLSGGGHPPPPAARGGKGAGKTFLFTGTLSMPRARVAEMVRKEGGTVATGISRKVDFLVAGADTGGKKMKAKELGIPILTEEEFLAMLGGKG